MVIFVKLRILLGVMDSGNLQEIGMFANRIWKKSIFGCYEATLTFRHLKEPDGYSREELARMLATVREHEKRQSWIVTGSTNVGPTSN